MINEKRASFVLVFAALVIFFNITTTEACETLQFKRGESSGTVNGLAPPDDLICYQLTTGQGQTATLRVMAGQNIIFSISGVVDAQNSYTFTTEKKTYEITVGQLMRAVTDEPFSLFVAIE